jgi:hypothetical protein
MHSNVPLCGGQSYTPQRLYTKSIEEKVSYWNRVKKACTIRDAETDELLYRAKLFTSAETPCKVGKDRMIYFTVRGSRSPGEWKITGTSPYFAASADDWFEPTEK